MSEAAPGPRPPREPEHESEIVDVTALSLLDLIESGDPAIVDSLRRILAGMNQAKAPVSGWGNFVDGAVAA
jgi:hypothetical protein